MYLLCVLSHDTNSMLQKFSLLAALWDTLLYCDAKTIRRTGKHPEQLAFCRQDTQDQFRNFRKRRCKRFSPPAPHNEHIGILLGPKYLVRFLEDLLDALIGQWACASYCHVLVEHVHHLFLHRDGQIIMQWNIANSLRDYQAKFENWPAYCERAYYIRGEKGLRVVE